ncbi:MAG: SRPBCC family protein [Kibdelosporangium sp.]
MGDYDDTITVEVAPGRLFSYLADVRHLPDYMPRLTSAEPGSGDTVTVTAHINPENAPEQDVKGEAWIHVIEDGKSLEWGATGPHDYRGRLHVEPGDTADHSTLRVELHTERTEGDQVDHGLTETLQGIKHAVEQAEHV